MRRRRRGGRYTGSSGAIRPVKDIRGIKAAVERIAKVVGCTITEEEGCTQPRTNMMTMEVIVEPLNPYWSSEKLLVWLGKVYHEIGHHAPEVVDIKDFMEQHQIGWNSLLGSVMNCVEDVRNELNGHGVYEGRDSALGAVQAHYCTAGAIALDSHDGETDDKDTKLIRDVLGWIYDYRQAYQPQLTAPSIRFNKHCDGISKYSPLTPALESMTTAQNVYDIAMEIIGKSEDHDQEQEQQAAQDAYSKGKPNGEEGEAGAGKSEGQTGEGEGEDKANVPANGKVSYKDLMGHDHAAAEGYTEGNSFLEIDYDHVPDDDYMPNPDFRVERADELTEGSKYLKRITDAYSTGTKVMAATRRLFQAAIQKGKVHNKVSGRLDKRDLYRIPSGAEDVFTRKKPTNDPKGIVLYLVLDCSGSMTGEKFSVASAAVALLNEALQAVGIACKIVGFTELCATELYIIKDFDERSSSKDIIQRCSNIGSHKLGNNPDGEAIMYAFKEMLPRREKRKVMIVLSDGQPASSNMGDCWTYTKSVIEQAERYIECYGIGIKSRAVEDLYKESTVINHTRELEEALMDVVKRKVFNL